MGTGAVLREIQNSKLDSESLVLAHHVSRDLRVQDFENAEWSKAHSVYLTRYWSGAAAPSGRQAEVRIIWSDEALCVRYVCNQAEPIVVSANPQREKKTLGLWDRDVCEIFIAPDPSTPERYFEFEAAPTGEWIDLAIHVLPDKRETDWEFRSDMTTAARVEKERITIAMRIPWDHWIHKPQTGERWRVNFFRCVGSGEKRGYLAWRPTRTEQPNFHVPTAFGWVKFA